MAATIGQAVTGAAERFESAGIDGPRLTAELLMAHTLGLDRSGVIARTMDELGDRDAEAYEEYVTRRESREPLEYITGRCEFLGRSFMVGPGVLIPRPETETLAVEAGAFLRGLAKDGRTDVSAADVCTGSGCIAISLALDVPAARVYATDISPDALGIAKANADELGVSGSIEFHEGDLLAPLAGVVPETGLDLIVSNPPYVSRADIEGLQEEVKREPVLALDGGPDGLDAVRRIIDVAPGLLNSGGRIMMEIGLDQSGAVGGIIDRTAGLTLVGFIKDHAGIERIVIAEKVSN